MTKSVVAAACPGAGTYMPAACLRAYQHSAASRQLLDTLIERAGEFLRIACLDTGLSAVRRISWNHPAIVACGLAWMRATHDMCEVPPHLTIAAGYSLGHFTALGLSGAVDPMEVISLVAARAQLMQTAAREQPGAMILVRGSALTTDDTVSQCPKGMGPLVVACRNGPESTTISGTPAAVAWAADELARRGAGVRKVSVGVAAHSPLMARAQDAFAQVLQDVPFARPEFPVVLNSNGVACSDPARIKAELMTHLTTTVRWDLCLRTLRALDVGLIVDVGPGAVMGRFCSEIATVIAVEELCHATARSRVGEGDMT